MRFQKGTYVKLFQTLYYIKRTFKSIKTFTKIKKLNHKNTT